MAPVLDKLARKAARSRHNGVLENIRDGWNNYSFLFFIGGVSAILGSLLGIASGLAVIVTLLFFYYAGKFHKKVEEEKRRLEEEKKGRKRRSR